MTATSASMDRGLEELRAAHALRQAGFPSQALSRASLAALHAAEAALLALDAPPPTGAGVVSAYVRRVVVQGGLDPQCGRDLRRLYEDRRCAEEALADVPAREADCAITDAERLVHATAAWIDAQRTGA